MRYGWTVAVVAALAGLTAGAALAAPDGSLSGHYYQLAPKRVKNRLVWPARNDIVDIAPVDADHALVGMKLMLDGKDCRFAGIARYEAYELVYRDTAGDPTRACLLSFSGDRGQLTWRDNGRCSAHCPNGGMAGSIAFAHRGAPPSRAALQRLPAYAAAMAEWRGAPR